jgi:two-component system response regulator AtoC
MSETRTILIADDEPNIRRVLQALFNKNGFQVLTAENGRRAIEIASNHPVDVLVSDLIMPDMTGVEVLRAVKSQQPNCAAILITAYGTIKTAVEAMRLGAYNYITKPFDLNELHTMVKQALEAQSEVVSEAKTPRASRRAPAKFNELIGNSEKMKELLRTIERAADSRATVLVRGESGVGKELVARALHANSSRASKPFVAISCAALPETLLESELFGHEKSAFTGASSQRTGRFELAHTGTLFLDEIAEIPPSLQVKLLRVLQEREFERLGGTKSIKVDVRLVAATNKDLEKAVAEGEFRQDLYYRLQVIQIYVPALRERQEDIPLLVNHFLEKYCRENDRAITAVAPETMELLLRYPFPGNVRELENAIESAVVLADRNAITLTPDLLPINIQRNGATATN